MSNSIARPGHDSVWQSVPSVVRTLLDREPRHRELCREISFILERKLRDVGVEVAAVTWRVKTLSSFLEKVQRKHYVDPFNQVSDLAGVRVVCLYETDCERVVDVIKGEFDVKEIVDKRQQQREDQFGYLARHVLVTLGSGSSGARYDVLKGTVCEIQVRTVLQDAWAIIQHHLVYKQERDVPHTLKRKLNSLAGLLETADDQFENVRRQREAYIADVRASLRHKEAFLRNELNIHTFREFLDWKFPGQPREKYEGQAEAVFGDLDRDTFTTLEHLDNAIDQTAEAREAIGIEADPVDLKAGENRPSVHDVVWAASILDDKMLELPAMPAHWREAIAKRTRRSP